MKNLLSIRISAGGASPEVLTLPEVAAYTRRDGIEEFNIREKQTMDFVNEKIGRFWKAKIEEVTA